MNQPFVIGFVFLVGVLFGWQFLRSWGSEEVTLPIRVFGETYNRNDNPTMFSLAQTTNFVVAVAAIGFVAYQAFLLATSR